MTIIMYCLTYIDRSNNKAAFKRSHHVTPSSQLNKAFVDVSWEVTIYLSLSHLYNLVISKGCNFTVSRFRFFLSNDDLDCFYTCTGILLLSCFSESYCDICKILSYILVFPFASEQSTHPLLFIYILWFHFVVKIFIRRLQTACSIFWAGYWPTAVNMTKVS